MAKVVEARAFCNNEVAYLAWKTDGKINDCLGFMITRINLDNNERRCLPAWVAFDTQSNPSGDAQDTSVWPIQKFSWRDLTLRRSRDSLEVRAPFRAKYEIVPVGPEAPGRVKVPPSDTAHPGKFTGDPIPMFVCGEAGETNEFTVTDNFGDVSAFFNNGILSTQNLRQQLKTPAGKAPTKQQIDAHISDPTKFDDPIRTFLAGDVLPALKSMFARADQENGRLHLALYELDDPELVSLLVKNQARLNLILSTAGSDSVDADAVDSMAAKAKSMVKRSAVVKKAKKKTAAAKKKTAKKTSPAKKAAPKKAAKKAVKKAVKKAGKTAVKKTSAKKTVAKKVAAGTKPKKVTIWDVTNKEARAKLSALMGSRFQNRMFNNSAHIGHNKFAVLLDKNGKPIVVWSGSTNWTPTGLCAQSNNTIVVESDGVAKAYFDYWTRLHADKLPLPDPIGAPLASNQGDALRKANETSSQAKLDGGKTQIDLWYSPNTPKTGTPKTRTVPPDLEFVFSLMKKAKDAIFFLVFNPGRTKEDPQGADINTVVSAAIDFGRLDPKLTVFGAISDPTAVPGFVAPPKGAPKDAPRIPAAAIFSPVGCPNVLMIRAAAISDLVGDFQKELLSAGHAIIHDKIVVIDPMSETDCVVITGSHNQGFKASYANDENMLILRGNKALALAYTVHVLDIYDHYKFRAVLEQQKRDAMLAGKPPPKRPTGKGFLQTTDKWQDPYISGEKGKELAYFLR
jgi:phosphatidylserine/phosphatidylglycerophosphate/cardiolipin synthase-like enzyme